jgi:hypothetical protein
MRKITSAAAAAAVVLTSLGFAASPAEARGRYGGWGYRHHDRIDAGDVIGGLLIIGTIAAIASAASKDRTERRDRDWRYDPPYRDEQDRRDAPRYRPRDGGDAYPGAQRSETEARAADACSWAVEGEMGDDARVDSITETSPDGNGWYVTGTASRLGGETRDFDCRYRGGRVVDVQFR